MLRLLRTFSYLSMCVEAVILEKNSPVCQFCKALNFHAGHSGNFIYSKSKRWNLFKMLYKFDQGKTDLQV
jgi:hypothetical protein